MLEKMKSAWRIPELRKKIIYTFGMLLIYRLLCVIPVPGINVSAVASAVKDYSILDFMNMMTGGSFQNMSIMAMGITPYINSSIILQLLTVAIPALEKLANEGPEGRKKINEYTRYLTVVAENTYHGQNAAALVRHCEAFGIQQMHTVETLCPFRPSADVVRGTDKWVDIMRHDSTAAMLASLRAAGYRIVATTPHRRSCTPESLDVGAGPIALVFGTEREGISPEVAAAADEFLCIPMCGMVESLNVSASAAIVLYRLSERMRAGAGGWRLAGREQRELVLRWLRGTVRSADDILRRAGFDTDR